MNGRHVGPHLRRLDRFARWPLADQWLALEAFVLLGYYRLLVKRRGLRGVQEQLGKRMDESPRTVSGSDAATARRVARAIGGVRRYTPWQSNCFPQALTAQRLLARQRVHSTVYFGATARVSRQPDVDFAAHAWTRCGSLFVTGGDVCDEYVPIVWFSNCASRNESAK